VNSLKSQDVVVLLLLATSRQAGWTYASLAAALGMSASEVHAAARRAVAAALLFPIGPRSKQGGLFRPNTANLIEFILHGVRYVFAPKRGGIARGLPTAHAAPPLRDLIAETDDLPPVWPFAEGVVRGEVVEPLYGSVVRAAQSNLDLYQNLALVDGIRIGGARVRKLAADLLTKRLKQS
jgi:hypothetical protein